MASSPAAASSVSVKALASVLCMRQGEVIDWLAQLDLTPVTHKKEQVYLIDQLPVGVKELLPSVSA